METFRELDVVDVDVVEAERTLTRLTIEVDVHILVLIDSVTCAELIFHLTLTILKGMDKMMCLEEHQRAEDTRLVDGVKLSFESRHRYGAVLRGESIDNDYPVCRGLYAMVIEHLLLYAVIINVIIFVCHISHQSPLFVLVS